MAWPLSRKSKKQKQSRRRRAGLRVESLEGRRMLAGLVNIDTLTTPGSITIQGDNASNAVVISSTGNTGEYSINRPAGDTTRFTMNAQNLLPGQTATQITTFPFNISDVTGIPALGGINVDLAGSNDTFIFNNDAVFGNGGGPSVVNGNLNIQNDQGGDVNMLSNLQVSGSVNVFDDIFGAFTAPLFAPRLPTTPVSFATATGAMTTLTDVSVNVDVVVNQGGGNTLTITSAGATAAASTSLIQGGLYVQPSGGVVGAGGANTLTISNNTQIVGPTVIANNGGGSTTTITNSRLQGSFPAGTAVPLLALASPVAPVVPVGGVGLQIVNDGPFFAPNAGAMDSLAIQGTSLIGELIATPAGAAPFSQIAVAVNNGGGGSSTSFRADPAATGPNAANGPTIRGGVAIQNGADIFGTMDVLSMNMTNIFGPTFVYNAAGTSNTTITNSNLGSSLSVAPGAVQGFGNPLVIINDAGEDTLVMNSTNVPWGVFVNNDDAGLGLTPTFRHRTAITGGTNAMTNDESSVGTSTSQLGVNGANMLNALRTAFPSAFPTPAAVTPLLNQTVQASSPFAVALTLGTNNINANPLAPTVVGQPSVFAQPGDTVTYAAGTANAADPTRTVATSAPIGAISFTAPFTNNQVLGEMFTVIGPRTFAFALPVGAATPLIGDLVTINNGGAAAGQTAPITGISQVGNVVTMNFAAGAFRAPPSPGNSISIVRAAAPVNTPSLPGLLTTGEALFVGGGSGDDVVNIGVNPPPPGSVGGTPTEARIPFGSSSQVNLNLGAGGNNSVNIQGSFATPAVPQAISHLVITGGNFSDNILISNIAIQNVVNINLGNGIDVVDLRNTTTLPDTTAGGTVNINGGNDLANDQILRDGVSLTGTLLGGIVNFP